MTTLDAVLADLDAESAEVDALVADLDRVGWTRPTPARGWTIGHQIAHLAWTDQASILAATDPDGFTAAIHGLLAGEVTVDSAAADGAASPTLLADWRTGRVELAKALTAASGKIPWFGPPMSPASMATARIMETWAHGQDVADAVGVVRAPTDRLRNVAHIGVRTRDFSYIIRNRTVPADAFLVTLVAPSGETWSWGPEDAAQTVTGSALDFCLLVTQRRHRSDLGLVATGPDADQWLDIAQAFAGEPGPGRPAS